MAHRGKIAMKGVVFVELLGMAEDMLGEEVVDRVIDGCDLPSGGAYTTVGDYPCSELMALIAGFSAETSVPGEELQRLFGHWMMGSFRRNYPSFFVDKPTAFDMLESVEGEVHVEVRKIYPNAELPHFDTHRPDQDSLDLTYRSSRQLAHFCKGLVEACVQEYGTPTTIKMEDRSGPEGAHAILSLKRA
jgi:hypothetical protein